MSKPALGRGLGSLLKGGQTPDAEPSAQNAATPSHSPTSNGGVKMLLRGGDEEDSIASASSSPSAAWLTPAMLAADGVLVVAGCLLLFSNSHATRLAAGVLLVLVGAALATMVAVLNQRPAPRVQQRPAPSTPSPSPAPGSKTPPPPAGPKVRVHFVDEIPRQRKN